MESELTEEVPMYGTAPSRWPVLWGVVSIVFGVIGLGSELMKLIQSGVMLFMPNNIYSATPMPKTGDPQADKMMDDMMKSQQEMMDSMKELAPLNMTSAAILSLLAILLLIGGILLCMRKRKAAKTLQIWAWMKIVVAFFACWVAHKMSSQMMGSYGDMMGSIGGSMPSGSMPPGAGSASTVFGMIDQGMQVFATVMVILLFVWMLILPIFFLIWFNRSVVKEDMANGQGWRS